MRLHLSYDIGNNLFSHYYVYTYIFRFKINLFVQNLQLTHFYTSFCIILTAVSGKETGGLVCARTSGGFYVAESEWLVSYGWRIY